MVEALKPLIISARARNIDAAAFLQKVTRFLKPDMHWQARLKTLEWQKANGEKDVDPNK